MPNGRARPRARSGPAGARHRLTRSQRIHAERIRRRRQRRATGFVVGVMTMIVVAALLGPKLWHSLSGPVTDYRGDGKRDLVIEIHAGDSTTAIGETLYRSGVVATVQAFVDAAHGNDRIAAIQPGFYRVRTQIPAASAVQRLAETENRVGRLVIPEGRQLDDTTDLKTNEVTPGIFSLISEASCVDLDGEHHCVQVSDLQAAAGTGSTSALLVPSWALERVAAMGHDHRRLEGLIAPGTWNVNPAAPAQDILATLISSGTNNYARSGMLDTAHLLQMSPYDVLVLASLVQRESNPEDFGKVARVIYNRLAQHRTLEFDSTVNYPLDRREVATSDADRAQRTPWNTYLLHGLPATPICSPGEEALSAAERPELGSWLYFVTIDNDGTTLFTADYQQHLVNIELAKRNGVLDSSR